MVGCVVCIEVYDVVYSVVKMSKLCFNGDYLLNK